MGEPTFAATDAEAAVRYARFGAADPFPEIEPALLNTTDITDYVAATGMIFPFNYAEGVLKTATYEVAILGPYTYWDENLERVEDTLERDALFTIPPNTIAFVSLEPKFRIPVYLAVRFNLHIAHIHRGLLLGTGPLVDPGFEGRLAVPLHNLTLNPYTIRGGDGLIWLEVTKLSPRRTQLTSKAAPEYDRKDRRFFRFDPGKRDLTLREYLYRANQGRPIASSINFVAERAARAAENARNAARRFANVGYVAAALGLVAVIVGVVAVTYASFTLTDNVDTRIAADTSTITQLKNDDQRAQAQIAALEKQLCAQHSPSASPLPFACPSP